ncbi:MAG: hypothetical protein JNM62_12415 [Flavobacteriales bacterium]|nr:hypothetical protein [Flavobacteriales bacterium]
MDTSTFSSVLAKLFAELTKGTPATGGFVLNSGDRGMLASLDALSATDASTAVQGGGCIAAHTAHVSFGLSLMNRWATEGGNPFAGARWQDAWTITAVNDAHWDQLRAALRHEVARWEEALQQPRDVQEVELSGMIGSVAHTAYHLGAIRQILAKARGPKDPLSV